MSRCQPSAACAAGGLPSGVLPHPQSLTPIADKEEHAEIQAALLQTPHKELERRVLLQNARRR